MCKTNFKPGLYFNLSNEDYHADAAISCSGVKHLLDNPLTYWWNSALNPNKVPIDTKPMVHGRAAHCLLFEPEKFDEEFVIIAPKIKATDQERMVTREPDFLNIKQAINEIKNNKFYDNWFKGGYPEVSIFWQDEATGLNCRSRFDYLNLEFSVDYKTTQFVSGDNIKKSIANYQYNLQSAIYLRGLAKIITNKDIYIDGNDEQKEWVKSLAKNPDYQFRFLFQEKTPPYISRPAILACDILQASDVLFQTALNIYKINMERYGVEKWGSGYDEVEEIRGTDMPTYWIYKMDELTEKKDF